MGAYCRTQGAQNQCFDSLEGWDGVRGGRETQEGEYICIPMADSSSSMAETNATLQSKYPLIKNNLRKERKKTEVQKITCSKSYTKCLTTGVKFW